MKRDKIESFFQKTVSWVGKTLMLIITAVLIVLIFPKETVFKYEFQQGEYWKHENLISTFEFAVNKTAEEIEAEKTYIRNHTKNFFEKEDGVSEMVAIKAHILLDTAFVRDYKSLQGRKTFIKQKTADLINKIYQKGIIQISSENLSQNDMSIMVIYQNQVEETEVDKFYTLEQAGNFIEEQIKPLPAEEQKLIRRVLQRTLEQNILYSSEKTRQVLEDKIANILPTKGKISKGQLIIAKGGLITPDVYRILLSFKQAYEKNINHANSTRAVSIGQFLLVFISLCVLFMFLYTVKSDVLQYPRKMLLVLFVIFSMVGMVAAVQAYNSAYLYVAPLCLSLLIIRTFFNTRIVLYIHLVTIVIIGFLVSNGFEFVFYQLIVGMMTIISIETLEKRSGFLKTSVAIFLTYSIIYVALTLIQEANIEKLELTRFVHFGVNAILTLLAIPIIFVLEKLFGFTSGISLLEYSNMNNKILRELSEKAPGTFQHSVQVANIAEDIIHVIGGNAMLARVGALHHDVGKMVMPMFFIENQNTDVNPHDEISNQESARIITAHVADGISLAHRYHLPQDIIDFIRTHHGTSKTRYFYAMEKQQHPDEVIDDEVFTYKGIKPFSKETAVVMMVDAVEAASRSLKKHTEQAISELVENIIDSQIAEEQFVNANITFRDIERIKKLLKKELRSIYHVRIEYPTQIAVSE